MRLKVHQAVPRGFFARTRAFARSHAFTLVELLVVIAVIGLLASLVLAAAARAKDKARATACLSNLRQWGIAYHLYAGDNEDHLPRRGQGVQALALINRPEDWFNALPIYFGSRPYQELVASSNRPAARQDSVFICPAATDAGDTYFLPYGMNMNLSPWNLPMSTKLGSVLHPESVVALADAPGSYSSTYPSTRPYSLVARHLSRVNILFLAGQARAFDGEYVGCRKGDPGRADVRWLTGTESDLQAGNY